MKKEPGSIGTTGTEQKQIALLESLLRERSGERHAVILQDFPDPDALSCGLAYRCIAAAWGIEADILYAGRISHQENIAMVNLLNIPATLYENSEFPKGYYQGSIFVDGQGTTSSLVERLAKAGVPVLAVIDHHAPQDKLKPLFFDLRPALGACASIFVDYLQGGLLPLVPKQEHRYLATALMHGIISETGALIEAQAQDFTAAAYLQPFCDRDVLNEILHQQRSQKVMEVIRLALENRVIRSGFCITGVGYLRAADRDALPQAADFLLTEETVHTVIVFGIVQGESEEIHGSLRTTRLSLSPDQFLKDALGRMEGGSHYGGGKARAGGFEIPLGFLAGQDDQELAKLKWETFNAKIQKKFLTKIGAEDQ
ncbi:MAG: bifunctional oligoribonuclease/PAP phosphatase NrnA [Magnetococcales bacterium]|nr:bifunctional oligoribonuclease/PAP phosphatase NrnA [Magnetococcales bacterium]MBF0116083.1 bifunctional oligoribonuclease/PAP phosphatase NrnA [Magnetococcales bacterium]